MQVGDRVTLAVDQSSDGSWAATITDVRGDRLDLAFLAGGTGRGLDVSDVRETEQDKPTEEPKRPEVDDKSWPPKSIETKVPRPDGQK